MLQHDNSTIGLFLERIKNIYSIVCLFYIIPYRKKLIIYRLFSLALRFMVMIIFKGHYMELYSIDSENHLEGHILKLWAQRKHWLAHLVKRNYLDLFVIIFSTQKKI